MFEKACKNCKLPFGAKHQAQIFCSDDCKTHYNWKKKRKRASHRKYDSNNRESRRLASSFRKLGREVCKEAHPIKCNWAVTAIREKIDMHPTDCPVNEEAKLQANHISGEYRDCRPENLEWLCHTHHHQINLKQRGHLKTE